jgi:hypothetical protein
MYVIVLKPTEPTPGDDWQPKPTTAQDVANWIEASLAYDGPDVEVHNFFEQEG